MDQIPKTMNMDIHVGEMIEELVRVNQVSITEIARKTHVNRRSVYNWFKQKTLRPYTLHRICEVLASDFSIELPGIFQEKQQSFKKQAEQEHESAGKESGDVFYWMNKYIFLLEKYNELLDRISRKEEEPVGRH
ncbi:helix-turn-helix domain-containing protein [Pedobacter sp. SYSU D00535]|uniref:helix-turn-helix domain-containing protein n=1 Tax=Pedobacter sp. SYSU D00535 TaxID=2810308 RepID=UPI001A966AB1|nr:helix-turn-helix domain-containing protein [Pedobacter sp. SYSU D00535]